MSSIEQSIASAINDEDSTPDQQNKNSKSKKTRRKSKSKSPEKKIKTPLEQKVLEPEKTDETKELESQKLQTETEIVSKQDSERISVPEEGNIIDRAVASRTNEEDLLTQNTSVVEKMADSIDNAAAALDDINLGELATGLTSWGTSFMTNIVTKTKTAAENVITTLDPGMGNLGLMEDSHSTDTDRVNIVVCSTQQVKIEPVSEAFKRHWPYGSVHVKGINVQPKTIPDQPVGAKSALTGCRERISAAIIAVGKARELANKPTSSVSKSEKPADETGATKIVKPPHCYLAVENYIDQILPNQWFDISCLLLKDVRRNVEFLAFSQAIPVPNSVIDNLKKKQEEADKEKASKGTSLNQNGFDYTVGKMMVDDGLASNHRDWHEVFGGVSRRTCIYQSARTLAHQYISLVYTATES